MKFYDTLTKTAVFTSVRELLYGINCMSKRKVDEHSGHLTLRGLRFNDVDGNVLSYTNPIEIFHGLKSDFGIPVDISGCIRRGKVFRIKMTSPPELEYADMQTKDVSTSSQTESSLISLDEEVIVNTEILGNDAGEESIDIPWDWINSLENKKYDKIKLDEFASEKFNIKLNQKNTLQNMILDFKNQLGVK